jgi:hypothetical protein
MDYFVELVSSLWLTHGGESWNSDKRRLLPNAGSHSLEEVNLTEESYQGGKTGGLNWDSRASHARNAVT